jgi:hypothetical protein
MSEITADDALDLAKAFKEAALALGNRQIDDWDALSSADRAMMTQEEFALLDISQRLITSAVGKILDDAQASLDQLKKATAEAKSAVDTIQNTKKIIDIATALITLGAAITVGNPGGIVSALGSLNTAITS